MASVVSSALNPSHSPARTLAHAAVAGILCGFLGVVQSIGFGILLLGAGTTGLASTAIGMALFATAVAALVATFTSSLPGVVSTTQGVPIAALASLVGGITASMGAAPAGASVTVTVVVAVGLAVIAIGTTALLLGTLHLGRFVRFVPFPVIGGFLAGSGWLIFIGGLGVAEGTWHPLTDLAALKDPGDLIRIGCAAAFLVVAVLLRMRLPTSIALPQ